MMEGVAGSRLSRASSRYGPSPSAAAVFNGPVRKWKRRWVHVSPSPPPAKYSHSRSNGYNGNNNNNNNGPRLLLCRWTPLSASPSATAAITAADEAVPSEEPPKRKFRYTPIVVLEEQRNAEKKGEQVGRLNGSNEFAESQTWKDGDELNHDKALNTETKDSNTRHLDLDLCLKGHDESHDTIDQSKEGQGKGASSGGFWMIG